MMRPYHKAPRLYVDAPLQENGAVVLTKPQAHHLVHVLRLRAGAQILLFNGRDGEWLATLAQEAVADHIRDRERKKQEAVRAESPNRERKKELYVQCEHQTREQSCAPELVYCFAPLKAARLDYMVQKATEMGAGALQPVITQFTQNTKISLEKMRINAVEAAQQCGLLSVPTILPPLKLAEFLENWPQQQLLIFCDEMITQEGEETILTLAQLSSAPKGLLVGPEGGFSDAERETLHRLTFVRAISLGPRILRADTAAVAAMALVNAVFEH